MMSAFQNIIDLRFAVSDHVGSRAISDVFPRLVEMAETDRSLGTGAAIQQGDGRYLSRWLNDAANRGWRTKDGRV
ncbi:hypothetical protein [Xanthobacter sediminis]